jgi:hypothetical protein
MRTRTWVAFCLLLTAAFSAHAETRVALVIGNGAYEHAPLLRNPVHDARAIAAAFRGLGYSVQLVTDAKKPALEAALQQFAVAATGADHAVVYYSGHGIEVNGVNYLLPVEARIATERTVALEAVPLSTVMDIAASARRLGLVVLDACRDNPLANSMQRADGTKGLTRGLGRVEPVGRNLLVAYATKDGHVDTDGAGTNSPYTTAILEALKEPGLEVRLFWGKVHDRVLSATSRAQEPFTYGALGAEALYLNPPALAASGNPALPPPPAYDPRAAELAMWQSVQGLGTVEAYREYLSQYPNGQYSGIARLAISSHSRPAPVSAAPADTTLNAEAMNTRAVDYLEGTNGLAQSDIEAVRWFKMAAERGNARGQYGLGFMYRKGRGGLAQSDIEALRWYEKAAEQGDADAEASLGLMYEHGLGGLRQSDTEAVRWYKKAAEQGNAAGEYDLADMYERGVGGLAQSQSEALNLYVKAARSGYKQAQDYLRSRGVSW